jgi:hypothetical protein
MLQGQKIMKTVTGLTLFLFLLPAGAFCQTRPTFFFGGGPTFPNNRISDYLKTGFHFAAGGGIRLTDTFSLLGEFDYNQLGVEERALQILEVPDGNARVYSVTGNLKYNLAQGRVQPYIIGGAGWYRRTVEFTEPTTQVVTIFDPWWGYFNTVVPANQVLGSVTRDAAGVNAGGGVSFDVGQGTKVFAQIRWHRAFHSPTNTTIVPLTIGISF